MYVTYLLGYFSVNVGYHVLTLILILIIKYTILNKQTRCVFNIWCILLVFLQLFCNNFIFKMVMALQL